MSVNLAIEASSISAKGGLSHLKELIKHANPKQQGIDRVGVWTSKKTAKTLPNKEWLETYSPKWIAGNAISRYTYQSTRLSSDLNKKGYDILFVPGGSYLGGFEPFVTMSQNMLPFSPKERRRYGLTKSRLRFKLLRYIQGFTFRRASGVIFLNEYARKKICSKIRGNIKTTSVIPHGVDERFKNEPRKQTDISHYNFNEPFTWLYVSSINPYKHQWNVVESIYELRKKGFPVELKIIGPARPPHHLAKDRLSRAINFCDNEGNFVEYISFVPNSEIHNTYQRADAFVFSSTCENMPITLLEAMASGLPIASSKKAPMPQILNHNACFFDPLNVKSIYSSMKCLTVSADKRSAFAKKVYNSASNMSWAKTSKETMEYIYNVAERYYE